MYGNKTTFNKVDTKYSNHLTSLAIIFYMVILSASLAGEKIISLLGFAISAGNLILPLTYMIIACVTEVYGFKQARTIIITGAFCNVFVSIYLYGVIALPSAPFWHNDNMFIESSTIVANILLSSTIAYLASELLNAILLSWLRGLTKGKFLLPRALTSTSLAIIIDTTFMLPVIFSYSPHHVASVYGSIILFKVIYEVILLIPLWGLSQFLKHKEWGDTLTPFSSVTYIKQKEENMGL